MSDLKEGDLAPAIEASDENGELITLEEYTGKHSSSMKRGMLKRLLRK